MENTNNTYPKVLLLGNGLNLAFGGTSWSGLIEKINVRDDIDLQRLRDKNIPFPMQAILVSNNNLKKAMIEQRDSFWGELGTKEQKEILQQLLKMGFSDILTTNYSYELEAASIDATKISKSRLEKMAESTHGRVEPQYLLHSYNRADFNGTPNRVWHIHGESRKPNSMILGHYWYANQLAKMKAESDKSKNDYLKYQMEGSSKAIDSWIDAFILGDVYILGFGFDLSEIDLWWMLNRKLREKAAHGRVYYYDVQDEAQYEKVQLLKLMGVDPIDFGIHRPKRDDPESSQIYQDFYRKAIEDIIAKVNGEHIYV